MAMDGLTIPLRATTSEQSRHIQIQKMIERQTHRCLWALFKMGVSGRERTVAKIGRTLPHHQDNGDQG